MDVRTAKPAWATRFLFSSRRIKSVRLGLLVSAFDPSIQEAEAR